MSFTCRDEIEITGGTEEERRAAAALLLSSPSVDDDSVTRLEQGDSLVMRVESVDGLPEDEIAELAAQFPSLSLTLVYFSLDGEFYGYSKTGAAGSVAESEDFADDTTDIVARRYDGDRIAFVRDIFSLGRGDRDAS
jgi:hypothetical protein